MLNQQRGCGETTRINITTFGPRASIVSLRPHVCFSGPHIHTRTLQAGVPYLVLELSMARRSLTRPWEALTGLGKHGLPHTLQDMLQVVDPGMDYNNPTSYLKHIPLAAGSMKTLCFTDFGSALPSWSLPWDSEAGSGSSPKRGAKGATGVGMLWMFPLEVKEKTCSHFCVSRHHMRTSSVSPKSPLIGLVHKGVHSESCCIPVRTARKLLCSLLFCMPAAVPGSGGKP